MNTTNNQNSEERKPQAAQATQSNNSSAGKQMGDSSVNKSTSTQSGQNAGQAKPAPAQQQGKFTQQHAADKNKSAPSVDKGRSESQKNEPQKKDGKSC